MSADEIISVQQVQGGAVLHLAGGGEIGVPDAFVAFHKPKVGLYFARMDETGWQCCMTDEELAHHYQPVDDRVKDGVQGSFGGTMVQGVDYVEVEVSKDGQLLERVRVECVCPDQARAIAALAELYHVMGSDPEYFEENLARWRADKEARPWVL